MFFVPVLFGGLGQWVTDVIESLGYAGIAALVALENLFPPIPSELILPLAGFMAGEGRFWLPGTIIAATIGSVAGALALYAIGAWLGEHRLRLLIDRYGRYAGVGTDDLDRADAWFDRHGPAAIFLGRLVPVIRSIVSIPAGLRRMPLPIFVVYTAIGSSIWNGVLITLGWVLGDQWEEVERFVGYLQYVVIAAIVALACRFLWKRRFSSTSEPA